MRTFRALALYYTGQTDAAAELMKAVVEASNMHGVRPFMAMFLSAQESMTRRSRNCRRK